MRTKLLGLGVEVAIPTGHRLLCQGENTDTAYLVLDGCVRVYRPAGGRDVLLELRVAGDLVGELPVLLRQPESTAAIAATGIFARRIAGAEFRAFADTHTELLLEINAWLAERLRWSDQRLGEQATLDAPTRVCRVLLSIAASYGRPAGSGRDLGVPLTQTDVAALTGVRLATVEKALRALAAAGLVWLGYRRIVVLDTPGLRRAAALDPV